MMRKTGLVVIVVAVVAAIVASFVLRQGGALSETLPAAQFLPGDTLVFVEVPDLPRTRERWHETALATIAREPEVAAFLERPLSRLPRHDLWEKIKTHSRAVRPRQLFAALTALEGQMPRMAAGFSYDGPKEALEAVFADLRHAAAEASPAGKSELIRHGDDEIESFSDRDVTVAWVLAGNWCFCANDLDLLKATLDRYRNGKTEGTLAGDPHYRKSTGAVAEDPELRLFIQPAPLVERLAGLSAASGQPMKPQQIKDLKKIEGIAFTSRFYGPQLHDSLFLLSSDPTEVPRLTGSTLALAGADTLLYYATAFNLPREVEIPEAPADLPDTSGVLAALSELRSRLKAGGWDDADFAVAFGHELGGQFIWPKQAPYPLPLLTLETGDHAKARKLAEIYCAGWSFSERNGLPYWQGPELALPGFAPVLTLTDKHLILGLDTASVETAATAPASIRQPLGEMPAFKKAFEALPKPTSSLAYLDTREVFERIYGAVRPMAMIWVNFIPGAAEYVDISKLPETETIAQHLTAGAFSVSQNAGGFLMESTGTLTMFQQGLLIGGVAGAAAVPLIQGKVALPGLGNPLKQSPASSPATPPWMPPPAPAGASPKPAPSATPSPSPGNR
ncbi:MAG TPA: hypothetical protein VNQ90_07130 [Chthoniobacteraceae bacterium]|nr:hypothetical protein [Chthoniobacteraceae bacterium]